MSDLNMARRKLSDYFVFLVCVHFCQKMRDDNVFDLWTMMPDLSISHGRISDFVSIPLWTVTFVIKMRDLDFKLHWNTLTFFDQKMMSDLNVPHGKMPDIVSIPLFALTFVIKLRDYNFTSHWDTLSFYDQK